MTPPISSHTPLSILVLTQSITDCICDLINKVIDYVATFFQHYICCYQTEVINVTVPPVVPLPGQTASIDTSRVKWITRIEEEPLLIETNGTKFLNLEKTTQEVKPLFQLSHHGVVQIPLLKIKLCKQQLAGFPSQIRDAIGKKCVKLYLTFYASPSPQYRQTLTVNITHKQDLRTGCFFSKNLSSTRDQGMQMNKYAKWYSSQTAETLNTDESQPVSYGIFSWFNHTHGGAEIIVFFNQPDSSQMELIQSAACVQDILQGIDDDLDALLKKIVIDWMYQGKISLS